ncbi:unnamed protein product [Clonostachys rosea f. rosea IK726]|uniref:Uncharacterized protein n=1 Tax=Clonostachys rosea f. rosea IK726 TaxID=1349383 RepID=A0ACA9UQK4_BIOOC|nr:unnamed protein product [Clonostachys rosea f. rosea IK726]
MGLERMSQVDDLVLAELRPFHQMRTDAELAQSWVHDKSFWESRDSALKSKTTHYGSSRRINRGNSSGFSTPGRLASSALSPIVEREDREVALVAPMHLARPTCPPRLLSGEELWWPMNDKGDIRVHVYLCTGVPSSAQELVRYFNLRHLFGRELSPASNSPGKPSSRTMRGLRPGAVLPVPGRSVASEYPRRSPSTHSPFLPASSCTPIPLRRSASNYPAERICRELASKLPILGATLTQEVRRIRPRDKIVVPMPYPRAWPETVRYLSSGQPDFLSEAVRCNISNLGGRVLMAHSAL